jgi:putative tryptophan/tyrosine transport system substrate-binding protein
MRRRDFISLIGSAAATWPLAARAQQSDRVRRVGVLTPLAQGDPEGQARDVAFQQGLEKLGWTTGRNVRIDYRWGINDVEKANVAIAELLATAPDVILASTSRVIATFQQATRTAPIVFTMIYEPVAQGFVQNLAHPGGNITGFTAMEATVGAKWLELLKDIAPQVTRIGFMYSPDNPGPIQASHQVRSAKMHHSINAQHRVAAALPRAAWIAEIDLHVGGDGEVLVVSHLLAAIPSQ